MSIGLVVLLYGPIAFVSGLVGAEALTEADGGTAGLLIYLGAISAFMFVFVSRLVAKAPEHETIATGLFFAFTGSAPRCIYWPAPPSLSRCWPTMGRPSL